jgi:nitrogen fixation/metabolism regulation signal transduction histidine kinase
MDFFNEEDLLQTEFAPSERLSASEIKQQSERFLRCDLTTPAMHTVMDTVPDSVLVLNNKRQLIFCNYRLVQLLGGDKAEKELYGYRPGELLNCIHATKKKGGCGTTKFCKKCGGVNAILKGLAGETDIQECRIIQKDSGNNLLFRVWTSPLKIDGENFCITVLSDISHEKRRRALERIFFHDILNTVGSLRGCIETINSGGADLYDVFSDLLDQLSKTILDEINAQKDLSAAEHFELKVRFSEQNSIAILEDIQTSFSNYVMATNRNIAIDSSSQQLMFKTDRTIVGRVLTNMIKNALEAIDENETVTIGCNLQNNEIVFWVYNPSTILEDIQLQMFQRSFSTKGSGRGWGTYSIKLLTERYLKGRVDFDSNEASGTIFKIFLPVN